MLLINVICVRFTVHVHEISPGITSSMLQIFCQIFPLFYFPHIGFHCTYYVGFYLLPYVLYIAPESMMEHAFSLNFTDSMFVNTAKLYTQSTLTYYSL